MNSFKKVCIQLRKKDHSLLEIATLTGRPKTSVYHHIKHIPLSSGRILVGRQKNITHLRKISLARKGKSSRVFKTFTNWDEKTVNLVAHLLFDGEIKNNGCIYNNRNLPLLQEVQGGMRHIYAFPPSRYLNALTGVSRIAYFNVALSAYIKEKS